ncbi:MULTISPECIES: homoserine kinase [Streptococcus]|jgi:homoserine kinase|uniref:homoserine kinase n=1 Tax=Streptococcus TaxID=1301 RepID=UPI0008A4195C|nr:MULTISPECIES: homoserine kinase [Streptococcus]MDB8616580.1 homoserine kinase [Streptococcus parasanguinis]MDB8623520.1 homoserine kinase [Streptococcus parasanguinis]OFQ79543.1 homoserine kinase [Streptococcus sp. HMSC065C01]OHQ86953.1 homoserine kinase [Streptococcus sp. HMSC076C09]WNN31025.1 homoserine kinase [Streptococcus parasanguinis]
MKIIVPATSANVGPGFDSVGIAVTRYLTIEVLEPADAWFIEHDLGAGIPTDEKNLLLSTALSISTDMQPHRIKMTSEVPLARGLGSSSSVIVAGIELANQLANLQLSDAEKLRIATEIEGHPDNVAPAIFGNMVIASYIGEDVQYVTADFPSCDLVAFVPSYQLKTSDSRNVLPKEWSYKEAVAASSVANVAIAALLKGDLETAGRSIELDHFHERYRQSLVKEFPQVKEVAHQHDAYATYLSGAGPTIMNLLAPEHVASFVAALAALGLDGQIFQLKIDTFGVRVEK